ncbi:hypothetical protein BV22DRAFT_1052108, partial [Leucogyrophana mollusca]
LPDCQVHNSGGPELAPEIATSILEGSENKGVKRILLQSYWRGLREHTEEQRLSKGINFVDIRTEYKQLQEQSISYKETNNKRTYGGSITRSEDRRRKRRTGDVVWGVGFVFVLAQVHIKIDNGAFFQKIRVVIWSDGKITLISRVRTCADKVDLICIHLQPKKCTALNAIKLGEVMTTKCILELQTRDLCAAPLSGFSSVFWSKVGRDWRGTEIKEVRGSPKGRLREDNWRGDQRWNAEEVIKMIFKLKHKVTLEQYS